MRTWANLSPIITLPIQSQEKAVTILVNFFKEQ